METLIKDKNSILEDLVKRAEVLTEKVEELKSAENELAQINSAIEALGGKFNHGVNTIVKTILDNIASNYQSTLSWPDKIKYVVSKLGHVSTQEIITEIKRLEPILAKDPQRLLNNVTAVASNLASKGELTAYKNGVKNIYSLPKK